MWFSAFFCAKSCTEEFQSQNCLDCFGSVKTLRKGPVRSKVSPLSLSFSQSLMWLSAVFAELELSRYQHHQTSERRDVLDEGPAFAVDFTKCSNAKQINYDQLWSTYCRTGLITRLRSVLVLVKVPGVSLLHKNFLEFLAQALPVGASCSSTIAQTYCAVQGPGSQDHRNAQEKSGLNMKGLGE